MKRYERLIGDCFRLSTHPRRFIPQDYSDLEVDRDLRRTAEALFNIQGKHTPSKLWGSAAKALNSHFSKYPSCMNGETGGFAISCIELSVHQLGHSWPSAEMNESCQLKRLTLKSFFSFFWNQILLIVYRLTNGATWRH